MRLFFSAAAAAAVCASSAISECYRGGSAAEVVVSGWEVKDLERGYVIVNLENTGDRTIFAIDGYVSFADPLGRGMPPVSLPSIEVIPPGPFTIFAAGETARNLIELPADQFTSEVCIARAAYSDGTIEEFE